MWTILSSIFSWAKYNIFMGKHKFQWSKPHVFILSTCFMVKIRYALANIFMGKVCFRRQTELCVITTRARLVECEIK